MSSIPLTTAPNTRHLYLIRHAKTLSAKGMQHDAERELAPTGYTQAQSMQSHLSSIGHLSEAKVLCSTATRTKQTLTACIPDQFTLDLSYLDAIYAAHTSDLLILLEQYLLETKANIIVIGHNPALDQIVRWLGQSNPLATRGMGTGCIAHFSGSSDDLHPDYWGLQSLFRPDR